ncbi:MAG TPA: DUF4142 domain-containing protein [Chitinophagaceae bacterium]|nr:DUF4142 domain-containing protein [Chitinophagaceae bacterium]
MSWRVIPAILIIAFACKNSEKKDSVEVGDTTIPAMIDTTRIPADSASADFLSEAARAGKVEVDLAGAATQKATSQKLRDFASMLLHDHTATNEQVRDLAARKVVQVADSMDTNVQEEIEALKQKKGAEFDRAFLDRIVSDHQKSIRLFEKAAAGKDPDVAEFAMRTLNSLRIHLDSAKALRSSLK